MTTSQIEPSNEFWTELRRRVTGSVKTDPYSRTLYSTDASIYQVEPLGVFFPEHADDIQGAVEIAAKHRVPVLMRGGGTALAGQTVNTALVIDTSRYMDKLLEVNKSEKWARVQPGLVLDSLNAQLSSYGLQYGPDPASSNRATMGGIVSNNSTGSHSLVYGMTAQHVLDASVVLSDGTATQFGAVPFVQLQSYKNSKRGLERKVYDQFPHIIQQKETAIQKKFSGHWRRCGGYNLDYFLDADQLNFAKLICGAEGTLAALSEMRLNLVDKPKFTGLGIVHFHDDIESLRAVPLLLETKPDAIEIMEELGLSMCRESVQYSRMLTFLEGEPKAILITEYTGESQAEVIAKLDQLDRFIQQHKIGYACVRAEDLAQQAQVWGVRKVSLGLLMSVKGDHKPIPFIEDSAVPVEHLAEYISRVTTFCRELDVRTPFYAHASAGCLHIRPMINLKDAQGMQKMQDISRAACELILAYDGAWSSEHGDGRVRSPMNEYFYGSAVYKAFQEVKTLFDPHNMMNPNNIVNAVPMTENLRYGLAYETIPLQEHIDFSAEQGFHRAVEMCNGAAVCRKGVGTMCPSFMVTKDEEHSTRGRANLLRAALSGNLPAEELTSKRMFEAMDLCIECKACKAECPSSVDMAKIKFEFMAQYYEKNSIPFRNHLFVNIPALSRLNSGLIAPLANWALALPLVRQMMENFFGISRHRTLPAFAAVPFTTWFKKHQAERKGREMSKKVVLFNDTFNTYNTPEVAIAATEVFEAAGYQVILPGHYCCGRPLISKGLVDRARQAASDTVAKLAPYAEQGIPIIGLEPSCVLSFKDEYLSMLADSEAAQKVADMTTTFEEFIANLLDNPDCPLSLQTSDQGILLHGHCHQKSLVGTGPSKKVLGQVGQVEEVDSGCCGMAGAFGYEAEHYEISLAMAKRQLLPAVQAAQGQRTVVAAGISCRQQIKHGTGTQAVHPAQVVREALEMD